MSNTSISFPRIAALALLGLSLAGNVLLARAQKRSSAPAPAAASDPTSAEPSAAPEPARSRTDFSKCPGVVPLEDQVARRSEAVRAVLPPHLLFESGRRNPEVERVLAPLVAAA